MNGEPVPLEDESSSKMSNWIRDDIENNTPTYPETQGYESLLRMSGDHVAPDDEEDQPEEEGFESLLKFWRGQEAEACHTRETCVDSSSSRNNTTDISQNDIELTNTLNVPPPNMINHKNNAFHKKLKDPFYHY